MLELLETSDIRASVLSFIIIYYTFNVCYYEVYISVTRGFEESDDICSIVDCIFDFCVE